LTAQSNTADIAARAKALEPNLIEWRRDFHQHPELSNQEKRTAQVIEQRLRAMGFTNIRTGVARHGIVATLEGGKPGPVVAWRADMDALPIDESHFQVPYKSKVKGVKHACGHDAHMSVALGIASLLAERRAELPGTVKFIFQPAEEGAKDAPVWGAKLMLEEGALENPRPSAIFAYHVSPMIPAGTIGYTSGPASAASDTIKITFQGKRAHGAYPHQGIDAVAVASQCIMALQTIHSRRIPTQEPSVLTLGTVHGGDRRNVIAETVTVEGTVRTFQPRTQDAIETMLHETLRGCTEAMGAKYELSYRRGYPSMQNDAALIEKALPILQRAVGSNNVIPQSAGMGAEDFSYFQKQIPGVMFLLGVGNEAKGMNAGLHTADFDLDESALSVGVSAGASLVWNYLENAKP
jgi:amidohydrolase